jgi:MFS family permease
VLVGLVGGVLLDRLSLRPVMVVTDLVRASAFFYLAASIGDYGLATVFVIAFLVGSMTTLFDGALYTLIPAIVPKERLSDANGFVAASQQANFALGPLVAGLFALATGDPALGLFVNGLTFVISAISLYWVGRVVHHRKPDDERAPFFTEAANGIRYIWAEPRLRITTIAAAIPNFVIGFIEATFVVLAYLVLGTSTDVEVGVLLAAPPSPPSASTMPRPA